MRHSARDFFHGLGDGDSIHRRMDRFKRILAKVISASSVTERMATVGPGLKKQSG
jgi:hypothetical protein